MLKILDHRPDCPAALVDPLDLSPAMRAEQAQTLRLQLHDFADGLARGERRLHHPAPAGVARGEGHFHLAPELFLQLSGWTRFKLPQGEHTVGPGEALLMPARLLHHETVGPDADGTPFRNLVIYADGRVLTCHLAHEHAPGQPGILYLEALPHPQAERILSWLGDAATPTAEPANPATLQARALVLAAITGVQRALDDRATTLGPAEPALIARLRVLVQNQLGDHTLSVRRLAEQSGCSADYLSHLFRQATGEHLVANINRQRMERAARLLRETTLAGKEVAWACGFAAPSYFIRTFRAHHGMTPKAWRETGSAAALA
ncbi:MAG: helix-turn-helix domain-containing protein [Leptothrix sp. (in: b-proteobacteria)]